VKLATIRSAHGPRVSAMVEGRGLVDLHSARASYLRERDGSNWYDSFQAAARELPTSMLGLLDSWSRSLELIDETLRYTCGATAGSAEVTFLSPERTEFEAPLPRPRKIFGARSNYWDHHHEMAEKKGVAVDPMKNPAGFFKAPSSVIGSGSEIVLPPITREVHHEVELSVVIGRRCRNLSEEEAWGAIAGYTIMNDVSARDLAKSDNGWVDRGKGIDTFGPMGPYLVTADEVDDPENLALELRINDEVRQSGNTKDLIFKIPYLLSFLSQSFTFEPGDVLMTGTCKGVGPIEAGDVMEASIEGLGTLVNRVVRQDSTGQA
jgi:2-keto-4-pentenoate hydratase/2-oxohepta-3-ene-1,7-dioic acid hydratase in catechol pathway